MLSLLLAASLTTSDINDTITLTERILIEHCIAHQIDCNKEAQSDIELVKQMEEVY